MRPEEVKLNDRQRARVILRSLDDSIPWKSVLGYFCFGFANKYFIISWLKIISYYSFLGFWLPWIIMPILELIMAGVLLVVVAISYEAIMDRYDKAYEKHLARIQKEILEKVDEEILK